MIIYGTGSKKFGIKPLRGIKCENCESNQMHITGYSKYVHIFWIPLFPVSKKIFTICGNCEEELPKKHIPKRTLDRIKLEKSGFKIPFYLFSGSLIILALIFWGMYSIDAHDKEFASNMANVQPNDVLVFKNDDETYYFGEVQEVKNDTLHINFCNYIYEGGAPSEYSYNKEKNKVGDFYNRKIFYMSQKNIDSLYSAGDIYDLYRENDD